MNKKIYQYVLPTVQIQIQISGYQIQRLNIKQKIFFAMAQHLFFEAPSDAFPRHIGGDEDQKKEPNQVTYTCSIIKIH